MTAENKTDISDAKDIFICDCHNVMRSACQGEGFFKEHEDKRYCVLHYPGKDKIEAFRAALKRKLDAGDFDFSGVWFPEKAAFGKFEFTGEVTFWSATFSANAFFQGAKFSANAFFKGATFSAGAIFREATFSANAFFTGTTFSAGAIFREATFSANAFFTGATFSAEAFFAGATFKSYLFFAGLDDKKKLGEAASLDFHFAHIETPEHISFHSLYLRPHWFINIDCRKFEFTNVEWNFNLKEELISTSGAKISASHRLLAIAYRQLADNAEANHLYHEASRFRYNAFEARRIERFKGFVPWRLDWWYWLASGYGERVGQAFLVFVALVAMFAFGYSKVGFKQENEASSGRPAISQQRDVIGKPLEWKEALAYSAYVSILQKPDPKPLTFAAQSLVWAETILGPAQAALLALAIRRRFMR